MRYRFVHLKVLGVPFLPQIRPKPVVKWIRHQAIHSAKDGALSSYGWVDRTQFFPLESIESRYFLGHNYVIFIKCWGFFPTQRI